MSIGCCPENNYSELQFFPLSFLYVSTMKFARETASGAYLARLGDCWGPEAENTDQFLKYVSIPVSQSTVLNYKLKRTLSGVEDSSESVFRRQEKGEIIPAILVWQKTGIVWLIEDKGKNVLIE
jgi:hypothetical protein